MLTPAIILQIILREDETRGGLRKKTKMLKQINISAKGFLQEQENRNLLAVVDVNYVHVM